MYYQRRRAYVLPSLIIYAPNSYLTLSACPWYRWGPWCRRRCHCKLGADCDDVTGACPGPCAPTWGGPDCQTKGVCSN